MMTESIENQSYYEQEFTNSKSNKKDKKKKNIPLRNRQCATKAKTNKLKSYLNIKQMKERRHALKHDHRREIFQYEAIRIEEEDVIRCENIELEYELGKLKPLTNIDVLASTCDGNKYLEICDFCNVEYQVERIYVEFYFTYGFACKECFRTQKLL